MRAVAFAWREAIGEKGSGQAITTSRLQSTALYRHFQTHCETNGNLRDEATVARKLYAVVGMHRVISNFQSQPRTSKDSAVDASAEPGSWFACSAPEKIRFFMEVDGRSYLFVDIGQDVFDVIDKVVKQRNEVQHPVQSPRRELEDGEVSDEDGDSGNDLVMVSVSAAVDQDPLIVSATSAAPTTAKSSDTVGVEVCVSATELPRCAHVNSCEAVNLTGFAFLADSPRGEDVGSSQASCTSLRATATDLSPLTAAKSRQGSKDVATATSSGNLVDTFFQDAHECDELSNGQEKELKKWKLDPDLRLVIGLFSRQVQHISDLVHQIREERDVELAEREKFMAFLQEDREDRKRDREERAQLHQLLYQDQQQPG